MAGVATSAVVGVMAGTEVLHGTQAKKDMFNTVLSTLTVGLGTSFGIGCIVGVINPYILLAVALTGLPLAAILLYVLLKRRRLIAKYRKSEEHLIKP